MIEVPDWEAAQGAICRRFGQPLIPAGLHLKCGVAHDVAVSRDVLSLPSPLNGLRHPPSGDTTGWYIWAGAEMPTEPDSFVPLHTMHLKDHCSDVFPYLGLPAGWRFLLAPGHEDVWYDASLLNI